MTSTGVSDGLVRCTGGLAAAVKVACNGQQGPSDRYAQYNSDKQRPPEAKISPSDVEAQGHTSNNNNG